MTASPAPAASVPDLLATPSFTFHAFLADTVKNRLRTEDLVAAVLPLVDQTLETHERGLVAPFAGIGAVRVTHGRLWFRDTDAHEPAREQARLDAIQPVRHRAVEIVEVRSGKENRLILSPQDEVLFPSYVTDYFGWEHLVGHHDPLTDIFSIGMILASLALRLDFSERKALTAFVENRHNLFSLCGDLHPVIQKVILKTTEANRSRRVQDLESVRDCLRNFRAGKAVALGQAPSPAPARVPGDRRTAILRNLRDRLFDTSRRNKLIFFEPHAHSVNLTEASVPALLAYQNLDPLQFFMWQPDLERRFQEGAPIKLNRYFTEESAPEADAALRRVRQAANRDEREFGFSNLRLVLAFLHWHNLRDAATRAEVIRSPMLLLPVRLEEERGVRDSFELEPVGTEAEINPALRHFLKILYNLDLPERIDLAMTSPVEFGEALKRSIEEGAHEISLEILDRTRIRLWRDRVRFAPVQDARPHRLCGEHVRTFCDVDYSYRSQPAAPLGVRLFETFVRPAALPVDYAHYDRERYETVGSAQGNPYRWEYDLCSMTLGNFEFQKMTLVHDYDALLSRPGAHPAFESLFTPGAALSAHHAPPLDLAEQCLIAPADPTQVSAIAWARTGRDMIIQGPPGTGKSQTITNLIADYVARGKRVLFVCEKRAALDVVFSRLGKARVGDQAVLIHDSQGDRGDFVRGLRDAYERLARTPAVPDGETLARDLVGTMSPLLAELDLFARGLRHPLGDAPLDVLQLLDRLIELRRTTTAASASLAADQEARLPGYGAWHRHGETVRRVAQALGELGLRRSFAASPLRLLSPACLSGDIPVPVLRQELLARETAVRELAALAADLDELLADLPLAEFPPLVELASRAHEFVVHDLTGLVRDDSFESRRLRELDQESRELARLLDAARERNRHWKRKPDPQDARAALDSATFLSRLAFPALRGSWWSLRRLLRLHYAFGARSVPPAWTGILEDLVAEHRLADDLAALDARIRREFRVPDADALRRATDEFRALQHRLPDTLRMRELLRLLVTRQGDAARELISGLHLAGQALDRLDGLERFLPDYRSLGARALKEAHAGLLDQLAHLPELSPALRDLVSLPADLRGVARDLDLDPEGFESAIARKTLGEQLRAWRDGSRLDGPAYRHRCEQLASCHARWIEANGSRVSSRAWARAHATWNLATRPDGQLGSADRALKREVVEARSLLEHQFGLKQRFKSIREIATGSQSLLFDLKPVWLMSPLSVSQTLPLEPDLFDVVIFDEASQIKLEDAVPSIFRGKQIVVVGDEMQLPPTNFFNSQALEEETLVVYRQGDRVEGFDLSAESLLSHAARRLPSTLLGWHYRSRHEALISFSNHAFYGGELLTIPDRQAVVERRDPIVLRDVHRTAEALDAALARSISFHLVPDGVYDKRRNVPEADAIAGLVRDLLRRQRDARGSRRLSLGVVAFSDAQQEEIERALERLARADRDFDQLLATERERTEHGEDTGLFVKNLENVQGDERDVILLSVCYAPGPDGKMKMNFGPINQAGGEKRLNVILTRARKHLFAVSSITARHVTNDWNDGARCLRDFLEYADAVSRGDRPAADRVLTRLRPPARSGGETLPSASRTASATGRALADALRARGHEVSTECGESSFKIDLAVRRPGTPDYELAILLDGQVRDPEAQALERAVLRPGILRSFGWRVFDVLSKDWYEDPDTVLQQIEAALAANLGAS
jgi:hypothetical protein